MHWLLLGLLAILAGFLLPILQGKLSGYVPTFISTNPVGQALVTGAFILVTIVIAAWAMKLVFGSRRVGVPGV